MELLKKLSRLDWLIGVYLLGLIILTSWTLFRPEFFRVHDYVHGARIAEITRAAQAGHFPVRWTQNFGYGYGMPLFEFYAPLPFYIGGLFYWLTGNLVLASKLLFIIPNVSAVVGSYLLGRKLYGRRGGVIVAAAYALAPYRSVNLFVRGAIGESWGMMAMPFALWAGLNLVQQLNPKESLRRLITDAKHSWWWLVFWLGVLFLSHNLSTLMFVPFSLVVLFVVTLQQSGAKLLPAAKIFGLVFSAYLLTIGLTAFYLFPALLEKDYTIIGSILSGYFHYSHHFLYIRQFFQSEWGYGGSAWGPDDDISFFLGYGQLLSLVVTGVGTLWWMLFGNTKAKFLSRQYWLALASNHQLQLAIVFGGGLVAALYLSLLKSLWLWDTLPLISFIQFPWRWLSIAILFLALLSGYGTSLVKNRRVSTGLIIVLIGVLLLNAEYFKPVSYLSRNEDFYYADESLIRREMSGILPDYIPTTLKLEILDKAVATKSARPSLLPINAEGLVVMNQADFTQLEIVVNRPHQKLVRVEASRDQQLVFGVAHFPGWQAEVDGKPAEVVTTSEGLVAVDLSAGKHLVGIWFGSTPVRKISDTVSGLSLLLVLALIINPLPRPSTSSKTNTPVKSKPEKKSKKK